MWVQPQLAASLRVPGSGSGLSLKAAGRQPGSREPARLNPSGAERAQRRPARARLHLPPARARTPLRTPVNLGTGDPRGASSDASSLDRSGQLQVSVLPAPSGRQAGRRSGEQVAV